MTGIGSCKSGAVPFMRILLYMKLTFLNIQETNNNPQITNLDFHDSRILLNASHTNLIIRSHLCPYTEPITQSRMTVTRTS